MNLTEKTKNPYWISKLLEELIYKVARIQREINEGGEGIPEAPLTGQLYGRQNGNWSTIAQTISDLQTVLDEGNTSTTSLSILQDGGSGYTNLYFGRINMYDSINGSILISPQVIETSGVLGDRGITLRFFRNIAGFNDFYFPAKPTGEYTLATTTDLLALGTILPTYVDNAAAVSAGLPVNYIYKTPAGDVKVRI